MKPINPFVIFKAVETYLHIPAGSICSKKGSRTRSLARHVSVRLCRELTNYSFPELGEFYERHHTTLIDADQRAKKSPEAIRICKEIANIIVQKEESEL